MMTLAGTTRRGAGPADVAGHCNGDHQHFSQFRVLGHLLGQRVLIQEHADRQKHGGQGVIGDEGGQG